MERRWTDGAAAPFVKMRAIADNRASNFCYE